MCVTVHRMARYLVFLRAVNLGPTRKFPKESIIAATTGAGFDDVATHIASGNVRVESRIRSRERVEAVLERAYAADRGFEVPCIAFTVPEFLEVAERGRELSESRTGLVRHYVYLLKDEPDAQARAAVGATSTADVETVLDGRAAHVLIGPSYEAGNVDPTGVAKRLGVATNRNLTVVRTLAQKWCAPGS